MGIIDWIASGVMSSRGGGGGGLYKGEIRRRNLHN